MQSLRKSFWLCTVFGLLALVPAFAGETPSSSQLPPQDLPFLELQTPAVSQAATCSVSSPIPSNQCNAINGLLCKPAGSTRSCVTDDGYTSTCTCRPSTCRWGCLL